MHYKYNKFNIILIGLCAMPFIFLLIWILDINIPGAFQEKTAIHKLPPVPPESIHKWQDFYGFYDDGEVRGEYFINSITKQSISQKDFEENMEARSVLLLMWAYLRTVPWEKAEQCRQRNYTSWFDSGKIKERNDWVATLDCVIQPRESLRTDDSIQIWKNIFNGDADILIDQVAQHYPEQFETQMRAFSVVTLFYAYFETLPEFRWKECVKQNSATDRTDWINVLPCATK